jgi:hypothetical protein
MRAAAFFALQSMLRDAHARSMITIWTARFKALLNVSCEMTKKGQIDGRLSPSSPLLGRGMNLV